MMFFCSVFGVMAYRKEVFEGSGYCDRDSSGGTARVDDGGIAP